jgi:Zn-finger nucleic acid-binding protein
MDCPDCHTPLRQTDCHGVRVDECPTCLGRWFDRDELRRAKDSTDHDLRWLDFDPFAADPGDSPATAKGRLCPRCAVKMGAIAYENSGVSIDKCTNCHGVWLDHDEFEKIVGHLEREVNSETAAEYREEAGRQFAQIFKGPEGPASELRDLFAVLHLLRRRFSVEHSRLSDTIDQIYSANPFK